MERFARLSDIKSVKTTIELSSTDPVVIGWNNQVPGEDRTYAEKHGQHIPVVKAGYIQGGLVTTYEPNVQYSLNAGEIDLLHISDLLDGTIILTLI